MLRVRDESGARWTLGPSVRFIEVYGDDGNMRGLVAVEPDGRIAVSVPGDIEFDRYARAYGSKVDGPPPPSAGLWKKPKIVQR